MSDKKSWSRQEIIEMWPQAKEQFEAIQRQLKRKSNITASRLGLILHLAETEFQRLSSLSVTPEETPSTKEIPPVASAKIEPEKIEALLREKCKQIDDSDSEEDIHLPFCVEVDKIGEGLERVSFGFENYEYTQGSLIGRFSHLLGPRYFGKLPALGCAAGGDWEYPVFFIVYLDNDGVTLRSYIPKDGNIWNYDTNSAFGNYEEADTAFLARWAKDKGTHLRIIDAVAQADIMFSEDGIIKDIEENVPTG